LKNSSFYALSRHILKWLDPPCSKGGLFLENRKNDFKEYGPESGSEGKSSLQRQFETNIWQLYESVVEEVISKVRESVLDEGLDESVLCDLKALWTKKLEESKAMSGPEPTNEYRPYVGRHGPPGESPNIYHPHPQAPHHRQPPFRHNIIQQQQISHSRVSLFVFVLEIYFLFSSDHELCLYQEFQLHCHSQYL